MTVTLNIKKNGFPGASAKLRGAIGAAFKAAGPALLSDMQQRTPVLSGELRGSEAVTSDDTSLTLTAGTDHALYVHQGTSRMGARPFMVDAVNAGVPRIAAEIGKAMESLA